jgi:hypothetical protein
MEERRGSDPERLGKPQDVDERNIPLAPLNVADVGSVQAGPVGKLLLRDAKRVATAPDGATERTLNACGIHGLTWEQACRR